jgi:preprotein translocase subunit SecA
MQWLLKKIVGTKNERDLKRLRPLVAQINAREEGLQSLSDEQLKAKTPEFRERLAKGETLDDLMVEAFAVVKNACRRLCGTLVDVCGHAQTWDMVPFDTQLIGGMVLHQGRIAEMATGEGKTLVATLPVYLNALTGKGVHVVTVNDYLALRDATWMGTVYQYLGLTVGCIQNQMRPEQRREQYACDITYGTNSEFGFDYLRDMGMAYRPQEMVQRGWNYAIVDEVDSILIDEARTPLIISGPAPYSTEQYQLVKPAVERMVRKQRDLCTKLMAEVKAAVEAGDDNAAMLKLYQVNQGMPKNKQLLHLLEEPKTRKLLEKVQSMMLIDMNKEQARELREDLYFVIDEKGNDASLTDKGCNAMNPADPDYYVVPDLVTALADLDGDTALTDEQKFEKRQELQNQFADKSERIHAVDQLIRAYSIYERDVQYVVQENQVVIVDENTGRLMTGAPLERRSAPGRRGQGRRHASSARPRRYATITIQNYFRHVRASWRA